MRRHLVLSIFAFTVGCQAVTGNFSVGVEGKDSGASGDDRSTSGDSAAVDSGGQGDSTTADSDSTSDATAADSGSSSDAAAAESGSADSGIVSDAGDAALVEAGTDSSDASQGACSPNAGTGAVGTLGCPCSTTGEPACNGNAQKLALLCSGGVWVPDGTCPSGQLCDTASGANQGTCQPIDPNCASASPGQDVCSNATTVVQCGPDLVADSPVATCTNQACESGACTGVCAPGSTSCASDTQLQTCSLSGTWTTTTCPNACVGTSCTGVCVPGATSICFDACSDQGSLTCGTNGQWGPCSVSCGGGG
jgi:hypothetical protein